MAPMSAWTSFGGTFAPNACDLDGALGRTERIGPDGDGVDAVVASSLRVPGRTGVGVVPTRPRAPRPYTGREAVPAAR